MKCLLPIIFAIFIVAGCSSDPVAEPGRTERPGNEGEPPSEEVKDYGYVMSNTALRFESDTLSMNFETGGILYIADGGRHRFIDLSSASNIIFDIDNQSLMVNGRYAEVKECRLIGSHDGVQWYVLLPEEQIVVVEEDK